MPLKFIGDRDNMYIYPWYISDITATRDLEKIVGVKVKKVIITIENDFLSFYYDEGSATKVGQTIYKKILKDKNFFKEIIKTIYKLSDDLLAFGKEVDKCKVKSLSDQELLSMYETYTKKLIALRAWGWVPVFLDGLDKSFLSVRVQADLEKFLKTKNRVEKTSHIYSILSSSEKMSEVQQEEVERLELLCKIEASSEGRKVFIGIEKGNDADFLKKYPFSQKLIRNHLKKFGWLTYAYSGPSMDITHLFSVMRENIIKGDLNAQIAKINEHFSTMEGIKTDLINNLQIPPNLEYLLKVSAELMFIKDFRKGSYQKSYVFMDKVMTELAKRLHISLKEIKYLVLSEVQSAINGKLKNVKDLARTRVKKCCYIVENGKITVSAGEKCEELIAKNVKKQDNKCIIINNQFKGMIAYGGVVTGRVKIVLVKSDVVKIKGGDILVSSSTNPDLIVAMNKAAAFVTDLGGITSHAAIVSRELKKPCVVGTKIATKILKDGDKVKVDADKGVVTIL